MIALATNSMSTMLSPPLYPGALAASWARDAYGESTNVSNSRLLCTPRLGVRILPTRSGTPKSGPIDCNGPLRHSDATNTDASPWNPRLFFGRARDVTHIRYNPRAAGRPVWRVVFSRAAHRDPPGESFIIYALLIKHASIRKSM